MRLPWGLYVINVGSTQPSVSSTARWPCLSLYTLYRPSDAPTTSRFLQWRPLWIPRLRETYLCDLSDGLREIHVTCKTEDERGALAASEGHQSPPQTVHLLRRSGFL